jgi:hydrophobe/amphiphile efflux-3 (HAE3) family protein
MRSYLEWVVGQRRLVLFLVVLVTAALAAGIRHLSVIVDIDDLMPQTHPYVATTNRIEELFGSKYKMVIGITPTRGDVFQPAILAKAKRITDKLLLTPGVIKSQVLSISARQVKNIRGTADGMEARPLLDHVPQTTAEMDELRRAFEDNPVYTDTIVSHDRKTLAILADFARDKGGFKAIERRVDAIVAPERDGSVVIDLGGQPVFVALLERFSERMGYLFPLALLLIGLIHYEAFRTLQALFLPLVTALLAVVWGLGFMSLAGVPLDVFNAATPILILAVAAGHAVQMLKRYYEEFHRLRAIGRPPAEANREAVIESVVKVGPVMSAAGIIAALGFLSLVVFEIKNIRVFGIFTALGILSALVIELSFIPALRCALPPPSDREARREQQTSFWDWLTRTLGNLVATPSGRTTLYAGTFAVAALLLYGSQHVLVDYSNRGTFAPNLPERRADARLNDALGGTNTFSILVAGKTDDAIKTPQVLRAMDETQRFLERQPGVGKTVSIVDFVKRMHKAMNEDKPEFDVVPDSQELVAQYLFLYSTTGEPDDFDTYVDSGYKNANILALLKTDTSAYAQDLAARTKAFVAGRFGDGVDVHVGGRVTASAALHETMVHGKLLNIAQIASVVFVVACLLFRSLVAGLLILVPLIMTVLANFGIMGLTGIPLNISNSVTSAMAIGIGADYAIYLSYRLREELAKGVGEREAVLRSFGSAGKAVLYVASAVIGGYSVMMLSFGFYLHIWMGILVCAAMLVSALSALTIYPALLMSLRPRFVFGARPAALGHAVPAIAGGMLLCLSLAATANADADDPSAQEIMDRNFQSTKVHDSISESTFRLINASGQERVRQTKAFTKLEGNSIDTMRVVRFLSPADVNGTTTLLVEHSNADDDIWVYLPALKKVRRLVSSNKKDSFVGTDFSYGDVIGHKVSEWNHTRLREEPVNGRPCWVIEATPRDETVKGNTGYSRRVLWVDKATYVALKAEAYDLGGQLIKTFEQTELKLVDPVRNKWQPMRLEAKNVQTNHRTVIEYTTFKANEGVSDSTFTPGSLDRSQ